MYLPLHDRYLVRRAAPETESAGGIALADTAQHLPTEGVVLSRGPGRLLDCGVTPGLQAERMESIAFQKYDFVPLSEDGREGIVSDSALVAVHRDGWQPCNEYVMVRPDPVVTVDEATGATVRPGAGRVLVVAATAPGGQARMKRRGQELYEELGKLGHTQRFREQPTEYYRHRLVWDFMDALTADERDALGEAIRAGGDLKWKRFVPFKPVTRATSGTLLGIGPGFPHRDGVRRLRVAAEIGQRVHWHRDFQGVCLGEVFALPARFLMAAEE